MTNVRKFKIVFCKLHELQKQIRYNTVVNPEITGENPHEDNNIRPT